MHTAQYLTFIELSKSLNFSATAKKLNLVQSTVSSRIKELEHFYNKPLFHRSNKAVMLTPFGSKLLPYAIDMVRLEQKAVTAISIQNITETIRLGTTHAFLKARLKPAISGFINKFKQVSIDVTIDHSENLLRLIQENQIDLAFVTYAPKSMLYDIVFGIKDHIVFLGPVDGPDQIKKNELNRFSLVHTDLGEHFQTYLGIPLEYSVYYDQIYESFECMLESGRYGFSLKSALKGYDNKMKVIEIEDLKPYSLNFLMIKRNQTLSSFPDHFIHFVSKFLQVTPSI